MKHTKNIKAVIFDLDGVIVDSEPLNDMHFPAYLKKMGVTITQDFLDRFRGTSSKTQWTYLKKEFNLKPPLETLMANSSKDYFSFLLAIPDLKSMPGLTEFIEQLRQLALQLAVGSSASKKRIDMILDRLKIGKHFSVIVSGHDVSEAKPEPDIFLLAAKRMNVHPSSCIVIEDAMNGVIAAKRAGMKCIGYAGAANNKQDLSGADLIIDNFANASVETLHTL